MEWIEHKGGIVLPRQPPAPAIHLFIDETWLGDRSGFLQACFPVPENIYDSVVVPHCRELLRRLGQEALEFKGAAIKRGNVRPYREFLHLFTNISADVSDQAPLYPVVSLDGSDAYTGQQFQQVAWNVEGALQNLKASDARNIVAHFSRQMLWLHRHLPHVAPRGFTNQLTCTFDAQYLHAEVMREMRLFSDSQGIAIASSLERVLLPPALAQNRTRC